MNEFLKNNNITKAEMKKFKTAPADGPIVAINNFFIHEITSIKIKKSKIKMKKL